MYRYIYIRRKAGGNACDAALYFSWIPLYLCGRCRNGNRGIGFYGMCNAHRHAADWNIHIRQHVG